MQILCSQCCAGFATNVSSDEGFTCAVHYLLFTCAVHYLLFTCAVHYLLNSKAIVPNYTQQSATREAASFSASQQLPRLYVTLRFNAQEAAGGLEDTFVCNETKPQFICRTASQFHLCVQNTTTGSVNMALEQNQQAVWRVTGF